jgi:hypothetical protein
VSDAEYRKTLLLTRIEAHRTILRLELRLARATFDPVGALLSLVGVDAAVAGAVGSSLRSVLGGRSDGAHVGGALVPLVVAALLPLVSGWRSEGEPAPEGAPDERQDRSTSPR